MAIAAARRALVALGCACALAACGGKGPDVAELSGARFVMSAEPGPPGDGAAWSEQRLPDEWSRTRPGASGYGWYRFTVAAPASATHDYAFYLTETLSNAQLHVNGVLAGQAGDLEGAPPQRWEAVQLFTVPRALLREGRNVLDLRIRVPQASPGGIGKALFGPHEALYPRMLGDQLAHAIVPTVASLTIFVLGCFLFVLWMRARNDPNYLLFASATMLWGLHTAVTLLPQAPLPPPHFEIWWNAVYALFVAMLCVFCVRFAGARWPRYERGALAFALASIPAMYLAAAWDAHHGVAAAVRLGAILAVLVAVYALAENAWRTRDILGWLLLATGAVAAAFGVHDWLAAQDPEVLRPTYYVPYAGLLFIALIGWIMIDRFVKTLRQYEALNVELERRVAEKSAALEVEAARQAEARRDAERANLAKSRFLAAASHDLRQPLHALGLFASALAGKTRDAESRSLTARINQSIAALESLFNEVLDVSRLDAGAIAVNSRAVALQPLFDRIANDLSRGAEEKNLALRFVPTAKVVRSDPVLLERILRNLVANAIRYTDRGGILVGVRPRAGALARAVRDSGIGIPAEHQARVFDEFYQVGNLERDRRKGLGLGLSIVKRLCDQLGHELTLASAPGRGTVFRIALAALEGPPPDEEAAPLPAEASLAGERVVVVDDERDVRDSMVALLGAWGCDVHAFATAEEALGALPPGSPPPGVLVADYRLPGETTGVEVVRALRSAWGEAVPAVLISGESSAGELARIRESGLPLLHKPVPPAKLKSLLLHLLAGRPRAGLSGSRPS